jgi:hypothetical protein
LSFLSKDKSKRIDVLEINSYDSEIRSKDKLPSYIVDKNRNTGRVITDDYRLACKSCDFKKQGFCNNTDYFCKYNTEYNNARINVELWKSILAELMIKK